MCRQDLSLVARGANMTARLTLIAILLSALPAAAAEPPMILSLIHI